MRALPLALAVFATQLAAAQQPVFRGAVDVATLDVTVVDKDGHPIRGLKPEDFVVTLDGKARPLRALDFIETGASSAPRADSTAAAARTAGPGAPPVAGRTVLILFDDLSYTPGPGRGLIAAGQRLLPSFGAGDSIGLATTSGLGPKLNPTRDRAAVAAALQGRTLVGRDTHSTSPFYIGIDEALEIERGVQKQTLSDVVTRECSIFMPVQPKNPTQQTVPDRDICPHMVESAAKDLAHVTITRTQEQLDAYQAAIAALKAAPAPRVIVALTAGLPLSPEHGDLQRQLEPVAHAASDAGVEFYALTEVPDAVDAADLTLERARARRSEGRFLGDGIQTVASAAGGETFLVVGTADRFFTRILNETSAFYRLGVELPDAHASQRYLKAKVSVTRPGAVVRTHTEAIVTAAAAAAAGAPPSASATAKANGVVTKPDAAHLTRAGAYSASELMMTWTDSAGASHPLARGTLPPAAVKFRVALELYPEDPAARGTGLSVRLSLMSLTAIGDESPVVTGTFVPVRNGQTLSVAADIPANTVPDGIFVVHAVVMQDGEQVGDISSSIQRLPGSGGG